MDWVFLTCLAVADSEALLVAALMLVIRLHWSLLLEHVYHTFGITAAYQSWLQGLK